jgi:mannose-1-phosphate guanylyltransferase
MKDNYCIIMAGGIGSRFWPLSKEEKPKQFLDILGVGETLIQQTFNRFKKIVPDQNFYIVTNELYEKIVLEQLPGVTEEQILTEPCRRNTAPCIAYACFKIRESNPNAKIIVTPADHLILKETIFSNIIENSLNFIEEKNVLLTLGIKPTRPETGYGYIQVNEKLGAENYPDIKKVKTFTEKPNSDIAQMFYESGDFFWNSGIFLWSLNSILDAFKEYLPDVFYLFEEKRKLISGSTEKETIHEIYENCANISIDYGIMEKAKNVFVYKSSDIGWSDLGTWGSVYDQLTKDKENNAIVGKKAFLFNSSTCVINLPENKTGIISGLNNFIVIDTRDALLICKKEDEQKIKDYIESITNQR